MQRKVNFSITESIENAIQVEAKKQGITESALLREMVADGLKKRGYKVTTKPEGWGGKRKRKDTTNEQT